MRASYDPRPLSGGRKVREVDLHLRQGQAGAEALERQLARFRGELNSAIRAGEKQIVFIHGSGTGRLRQEIRAVIGAEYPSCSWHDAPFARYGFNGATIVTIRK
ncbi:MAG: hypothetical protein GX622_01585 [Bacteroidales bacterium]|nr:hypothetical protein [Bacteroidales bacterium]